MTGKLTWEEIKSQYDQEWVELVDYDWPDGTPNPRAGVVRTHHSNKKTFHKQCLEGSIPSDSALVFVGHKNSLDDIIFVPSLIRIDSYNRIKACEK